MGFSSVRNAALTENSIDLKQNPVIPLRVQLPHRFAVEFDLSINPYHLPVNIVCFWGGHFHKDRQKLPLIHQNNLLKQIDFGIKQNSL